MKYALSHVTTYDYESPVLHGRHMIRKRPRPLPFQRVSHTQLTVEPTPVWIEQRVDYFGNLVDIVEVIEPHDQLVVTTRSDVTIGPRPIDEGMLLFQQSWENARDRITTDRACFEAREMQLDSPLVFRSKALREFAEATFTPGRPVFDAVLEFNRRIFEDFTFDPTFTDVTTPLTQVLREKRGVCQDFAHLAVGALRSLGLAARYVSGYLETLPPPGKPRLVGADASHAWPSVFIPDYGWIAFDPTNGVLPGERHIVVAWGRDFSDVSPLRGVVLGGGRHRISVGVDVAPHDPKPNGGMVPAGAVPPGAGALPGGTPPTAGAGQPGAVPPGAGSVMAQATGPAGATQVAGTTLAQPAPAPGVAPVAPLGPPTGPGGPNQN